MAYPSDIMNKVLYKEEEIREIAKKLSISEKSADNALQRARRKICNVDMSWIV